MTVTVSYLVGFTEVERCFQGCFQSFSFGDFILKIIVGQAGFLGFWWVFEGAKFSNFRVFGFLVC